MSEQRKPKRFLTGEQKYDLWVRMLTEQITPTQAAAEAEVDRSTISQLRKTAKDGAITALSASKPGRRRSAKEVSETAKLQAEIDRLGGVIIEQAVELAMLRGKAPWVERANPCSCARTREANVARPGRRRDPSGLVDNENLCDPSDRPWPALSVAATPRREQSRRPLSVREPDSWASRLGTRRDRRSVQRVGSG